MLTTSQAAARLGLTQQRIRQLCASGQIKATRVGRDWLIKEPLRYQPHPKGPKCSSS